MISYYLSNIDLILYLSNIDLILYYVSIVDLDVTSVDLDHITFVSLNNALLDLDFIPVDLDVAAVVVGADSQQHLHQPDGQQQGPGENHRLLHSPTTPT